MHSFDVVIIGSGPSGVALAERLYEERPGVTIAMIERGSVLLHRHFYENGGSIDDRDRFLTRHQVRLWEGDLGQGGALLPALGGRGIVGGSQLHRFYESDFTLWPDGLWPLTEGELDPYFRQAEDRLLGGTRCGGPAQEYVYKVLADLNAQHPPSGPIVDAERRPGVGFSHHSSVQRILALRDRDRAAPSRRLRIFTETRAVRLVADRSRSRRISHVRCVPSGETDGEPIDVHGGFFVLAASAVESARLVLASGLEKLESVSPNIGRYLMEHIYFRGYLDISGHSEINHGAINVFVPPPDTGLDDRYQVEIFSVMHPGDGRTVLRVTGSSAMDPQRHNRVTLSRDRVDRHGVPRALTTLRPSRDDERRKLSLSRALQEIAVLLDGSWVTPPSVMPQGASHHETGTLRIARSREDGAADPDGLLFGSDNVFVGDGAAFTSVGVANPILTLTAMGYRLADHLAGLLGRPGRA